MFVAKSQIHGQIAPELPIVLNESKTIPRSVLAAAQGVEGNRNEFIAQRRTVARGLRSRRQTDQEVRPAEENTLIGQGRRPRAEIFACKTPSEPQGVIAARVRQQSTKFTSELLKILRDGGPDRCRANL